MMLRDISIGGIGFLNAEPLKSGEPFVIRFSGQSGRQFKIHCAVQRRDSGGTGGTQYVIGATFEKVIEPTEALPRNPDGTFVRSELLKPEPVVPKAPVMPCAKEFLFQTPKVEVAGLGSEAASAPVANVAATAVTVATPEPAAAPAVVAPAAGTASVKVEEQSQPKADGVVITPVAVAQTIEEVPMVEVAPVVEVQKPMVQKVEERAEPTVLTG